MSRRPRPTGLRDIVFDVDPAIYPQKKGISTPPNFWRMSIVHDQMAGWMKTPLDTEVDRGPGHIYILDGVPAPAEWPAQQPPSLRPMLWPRSPISATAELLNLVLLLTLLITVYC